ncbi:MAG: class I SAM-dependent methyltransferase [Pedobacter sp.]|nr:MAG: class I SAM-dependent methyltransferase [Pedobacter sp.]
MNYQDFYKGKDTSYFAHTRAELLKFIPKTIRKVLDVGCASGNFGKMLKEIYGCKVWGIEPDTTSAEIARTKIDTVFNTTFDENIQISNDEKFDCIFFNDVLEHLQQPNEALKLASKYLNESGCIIASIPNIRYYPVILSLLRYKDFKYLDAGVMDKTHLRFFTKKSMIRLFEECDLKVQNIEGINANRYKYLEFANKLLLNNLADMRYPQFAIVASKI